MTKQKLSESGLGPSNDDIPEDEMFLAKLIQNVESFGAVAIRGAYFMTSGGFMCSFRPKNLGGCCASGAASLSPDTNDEHGGLATGRRKFFNLVAGNDHFDVSHWLSGDDNGETVGYAYQLACMAPE